MITLKEKDLQLNFRTKLASELLKIEMRLSALTDTYSKIKRGEKQSIEVGSRVKFIDGEQEGRVINIKNDGTIQVNRDGYKSLINMMPDDLQNLSVGTEGQLEKDIWLLETKKKEIQDVLTTSKLPDFFFSIRDNLVCIVKITEEYPCQFVEFVHAKDLRSYRMKLPAYAIGRIGFYHIECDEKDIISVNMSSEFAFKEFYKSNSI
ncbi:hypothetical protein K3G39_20190 [Pontibacter sp. HSC-14F20]|uniref:hypothetical protein n=1 Tax=Pontibacter sp. HSC-14F20 TaxID=2864136 RepID=UPI001C736F8A|nr:hypothetical protein [Pontibacter sp. HSC-14F20]MBX0335558.1 hypothetical protein [Pontibacter sp. HSC-14F20]